MTTTTALSSNDDDVELSTVTTTDDDGRDGHSSSSCPSWLEPHGSKIGNGWANSCPLDWNRPLDEQLTKIQRESIDFIVASDVVFLVEMLYPLLDTVAAVFEASSA